MKIEVGKYNAYKKGKDAFLHIDIDIHYSSEVTDRTGTTILLSPIGYFKGRIPEEATAFLYFASIVYAIDRSVRRERYSEDGWSREFDVDFKLPVAYKFAENKKQIEDLLSFLTGDFWICNFTNYEEPNHPKFNDTEFFDKVSHVYLFSGGLDSLIGAIDFFASDDTGKVFLASHYDNNMGGPKSDQKRLLEVFKTKYENRYVCFPKHNAVLINTDKSVDTTCRSRSLMFIAIALQVATYRNADIVVPENGSVSLNYPLSVSRRASCSTRTTHPVILSTLNSLFDKLSLPTVIKNPYEFMTKGEMVKKCRDLSFLLEIVSKSNSCGKRGRKQFFIDNHSATHCGRCMPCIYRKAALLGHTDDTSYGITLPHLFQQRNNKVSDDFYALLNFLRTNLSDEDILRELQIEGMGTLPNLNSYVDLVKRTRLELGSLISEEGSEDIKRYIGLSYD